MPFGVTFRAVATGVVAAPITAILAKVLGELTPMFNAPNHWLTQAFVGVSDHAFTIALLSALAMIIVRSITESQVRP
jgi:TRAP-type C4-dicarboxylate transport system substrate-binding protein